MYQSVFLYVRATQSTLIQANVHGARSFNRSMWTENKNKTNMTLLCRAFPYLINQLINCAKQKLYKIVSWHRTESKQFDDMVFIGKLKINYHKCARAWWLFPLLLSIVNVWILSLFFVELAHSRSFAQCLQNVHRLDEGEGAIDRLRGSMEMHN